MSSPRARVKELSMSDETCSIDHVKTKCRPDKRGDDGVQEFDRSDWTGIVQHESRGREVDVLDSCARARR